MARDVRYTLAKLGLTKVIQHMSSHPVIIPFKHSLSTHTLLTYTVTYHCLSRCTRWVILSLHHIITTHPFYTFTLIHHSQVHLVGHSMGGKVAAAVALTLNDGESWNHDGEIHSQQSQVMTACKAHPLEHTHTHTRKYYHQHYLITSLALNIITNTNTNTNTNTDTTITVTSPHFTMTTISRVWSCYH